MADKIKMGNLRHESNLVEFKPGNRYTRASPMRDDYRAMVREKDFPGSQTDAGVRLHRLTGRRDWHGAPYSPGPRPVDVLFGRAEEFRRVRRRRGNFYLDDESGWKINYPFYAYIPAGMSHEPTEDSPGRQAVFSSMPGSGGGALAAQICRRCPR